MKIAVCVKAVPDAAGGRRIDPATMRLDRSGDLALSDFDLHGVEEALRIRDAAGEGEGEVVIVSLGPVKAADAIRKTLAMGADRAVLVTDEEFGGADLVATAQALAGALAREEPDLVLFGQQSADGDGACLWAAVAELLRRPVISQVAELSVEAGRATGRRQTEFGYERIRVPLPAVVAVSDAINEPRYPSLKGIMGAKSKPQETLAAADVGGVTEARTAVLALAAPPSRGDRRRIDDAASAPEAILEFLVEKRLL
jgi:electron transfer flavoprotein beta subunit